MAEKKKSSSKASTKKATSAEKPKSAAAPREAYADEAGGAPVITASLVVVGVIAALLALWFSLHASKTTGPAAPASSAAQH